MDATRTTPPIRAVMAAGAMSIVSLMASSCSTTASAQPPATTVAIATTTSSSSTTSTTTSTTSSTTRSTTIAVAEPAPVSDDCWIGLARSVGWPEATLAHLAYIIHRESRCDPTQFADRPWTRDLSRGLLQINAFDYLDAGVRQICGIDPATLFVPEVNLACGLDLYRTYGWQPWGG